MFRAAQGEGPRFGAGHPLEAGIREVAQGFGREPARWDPGPFFYA